MKILAQTLGVFVGLLFVGVCVALGRYKREAEKPAWWDSYDNGANEL